MAATQGWLRVQDAVDELLRRQGTLPDDQTKLRIDRMVEQYLLRPGLPRSNKPPGKGGPR